MTTTPSAPGEPITDKRQLVEYLEAGCKPPADWRVGTEHEKFVFRRTDLRRVALWRARRHRRLAAGDDPLRLEADL